MFKSWDIETSGSLCLIFYQFDRPILFLNVYLNLSPKDCICIQLNFILNYILCKIQLQRAPYSAEICIGRKMSWWLHKRQEFPPERKVEVLCGIIRWVLIDINAEHYNLLPVLGYPHPHCMIGCFKRSSSRRTRAKVVILAICER